MSDEARRRLVPWRVAATRVVQRDRWLSVRADTCVTPEGVEITPYYVIEPAPWVHLLALDAAGRAVMVRQYRHGLGDVSLEIPGGAADTADASLEAAARRELLEEAGYVCGPAIALPALSPNPASHANRIHVFCARDARQVAAPKREAGETMRTELIAFDELEQLAMTGGIIHALHVAAVLMSARVFAR